MRNASVSHLRFSASAVRIPAAHTHVFLRPLVLTRLSCKPTWTPPPPQFLSYHPPPLPLAPPTHPLGSAVSLAQGDYTQALTWATQHQISSVCQRAAISIPASDKWPWQHFFFSWPLFQVLPPAPSGSPLPDCGRGKGLAEAKLSER